MWPIQNNNATDNLINEMNRELAIFFQLFFDIDVDNNNLCGVTFPTFEETLGILDLAERRKETLKNFDLENIASNSNRIRFIRQYLVLLMAKIIYDKLESSNGLHIQLVKNLVKCQELKDTIFLSSNYDILIDNALISVFPEYTLDYGVDFSNFDEPYINDIGQWKRPRKDAIKLLKIHGSLNWLYCPTCNSLTLTPKEKRVIKLLTDFSSCKCKACDSVIVPIIVPPTYFKDMSNVFLGNIWHKAEYYLRQVEHIIFCGYSFPDADIHIKYLLKRIQTNRKMKNLKVSVINHYKDKNQDSVEQEKTRYIRFLGKDVNYTTYSFEDFAKSSKCNLI